MMQFDSQATDNALGRKGINKLRAFLQSAPRYATIVAVFYRLDVRLDVHK